MLLFYSCAMSGQDYFDQHNIWRRDRMGRANSLETGMVAVHRLPGGTDLHLHCVVKLCTPASIDDCEKVRQLLH